MSCQDFIKEWLTLPLPDFGLCDNEELQDRYGLLQVTRILGARGQVLERLNQEIQLADFELRNRGLPTNKKYRKSAL